VHDLDGGPIIGRSSDHERIAQLGLRLHHENSLFGND